MREGKPSLKTVVMYLQIQTHDFANDGTESSPCFNQKL